ncbi:LuxR C-terminal-related transcriptional regulator [Streptomyces sp. NPDC079020]|uniref:helix-turn-helix transcriptional regulator n=1 Tax=Streptomyces sp. NPDC079020 TaxID=3365722 RepID=UPI0037D25F7E
MAKDHGRHLSADTHVLDAPGPLTADPSGIQDLGLWAAPGPRGGVFPYIPGEAGTEAEAGTEEGPGHRVLSPEVCPVVRTIELANLGTSRRRVIERTERVLDEAESRADARRMWRAILALLYTGDVLSAARDIRGLTRQEVGIARLARAGHSNRRIAEALFLTVRTVEFHLSNVYGKLSISGRREPAAALSTDMS